MLNNDNNKLICRCYNSCKKNEVTFSECFSGLKNEKNILGKIKLANSKHIRLLNTLP